GDDSDGPADADQRRALVAVDGEAGIGTERDRRVADHAEQMAIRYREVEADYAVGRAFESVVESDVEADVGRLVGALQIGEAEAGPAGFRLQDRVAVADRAHRRRAPVVVAARIDRRLDDLRPRA